MIEYRWLVLSALFVARTAMGFQFQSVGSTAFYLTTELHITYAQLGTLIGLFMLPGVVFALPGGMLGHRFGDKLICAVGLCLMILGGLILAQADGYEAAFVGRLLSGIGAVLFNLMLAKMVTDWFAGREIVAAMGVLLASWPFGIGVALVVQGPLAAALGWRSVMFATAGFCAVALLLVVTFYRAPATASAQPQGTALPTAREAVPAIIAGAIWGTFNLGFVLFFSFGPLLLAARGMDLTAAAQVISFALWVSMFSLPVGGYISERLRRPNDAIVLFSVVAGAACALLPVLDAPLLFSVVAGLAMGPPAGAIMAMPARVLAAANRAAGLGLFYTCFYAVMAVGPAAAGFLLDRQGGPSSAMFLAGGIFMVGVPLLVLAFHRLAATPQTRA